MKTILEIEEYGITVTHNPTEEKPFSVEFPDPAVPVYYSVDYEDLPSAIDRVTDLILDPRQVYSMEELPEDIQAAYTTVTQDEQAHKASASFIREVLYSIAYTSLKEG